jgi:hypothetical protein
VIPSRRASKKLRAIHSIEAPILAELHLIEVPLVQLGAPDGFKQIVRVGGSATAPRGAARRAVECEDLHVYRPFQGTILRSRKFNNTAEAKPRTAVISSPTYIFSIWKTCQEVQIK